MADPKRGSSAGDRQMAWVPPALNPEPQGYPPFGPPFAKAVIDQFSGLHHALAKLGDRLRPRDQIWKKEGTMQLNASGTGTIELVTVPPGYELFLHRLYVNVAAGTFSSPVTGGMVEIQVDQATWDGVGLGTNGLPQVFTASTSQAVVAQGGQRIEIVFTGSTASAKVVARAQGRLIRSHVSGDES